MLSIDIIYIDLHMYTQQLNWPWHIGLILFVYEKNKKKTVYASLNAMHTFNQ